MSRKKNDAFSEAIVGLFMLAVLALLVYFTVIISGVDVLQGREKVRIGVVFDEVGGLKDHDSVMYRGTKVGAVERIDLSPTNLIVIAEIDNDVVLRTGYRIAVCNLSMLGGNYLLLEEGPGEALPLVGTVFRGEKPSDWMRDVANIARNLNDFTSGGELKAIVANLQAASESIKVVTDRIMRGEGTIGKLLSSDDTLYRDVRQTVANTAEITDRLRRGEGTLGRFLSTNDTVYADFQKTMANVAEISDRLHRGEGLVGRLLAKDDPLYAQFDGALADFRRACASMDLTETKAGANRLLENLNAVAEKMKNGEGTLGRLMTDDALYGEVEGLAKDVRQVIDNFRDTTPISTFGSLILGGL
ncbi:MAG: MlaD family protein [Kiritimatiellia bacterium]